MVIQDFLLSFGQHHLTLKQSALLMGQSHFTHLNEQYYPCHYYNYKQHSISKWEHYPFQISILAGYLYPTLLTKSTVENSPFICFVYCSTTKFIFSFSFYRTGALMDNVLTFKGFDYTFMYCSCLVLKFLKDVSCRFYYYMHFSHFNDDF
jgi:hypothetical protein